MTGIAIEKVKNGLMNVFTVCPGNSSAHAAGDCTGAVGALLANGDRTALIKVDTRRDKGSAGVGVMTVDAGAGAITAGAALEDVGAAVMAATGVDANDGRPAGTTLMASRRLGRAVSSVVGALTASGFGLVFIDVLPDAGREVTRPLRRASVPGASSVAGVVAAPVNEVEVDGVRAVVAAAADEPVVVCLDLLTAVSWCGFSGRR